MLLVVRRWPNIVLMLGQRQRRWTNIETMLGERPVSDGKRVTNEETEVIFDFTIWFKLSCYQPLYDSA